MESSEYQSAQKLDAADPKFCFTGNKKQYHLKKEISEKVDEVLAMDDSKTMLRKLTKGKDLLVERNKQNLRHSWDTVTYYAADPLP